MKLFVDGWVPAYVIIIDYICSLVLLIYCSLYWLLVFVGQCLHLGWSANPTTIGIASNMSVFVIRLSIFALTPVPIHAHSRSLLLTSANFYAYRRSLPHLSTLTPAPTGAHSCAYPCHSRAYPRLLLRLPAPIRAHSCSLPLTPARVDAGISMGEWQKPTCLKWITASFWAYIVFKNSYAERAGRVGRKLWENVMGTYLCTFQLSHHLTIQKQK